MQQHDSQTHLQPQGWGQRAKKNLKVMLHIKLKGIERKAS